MIRVLDFGGPSKEAVIDAFRRIVAGQAIKIFVLPSAKEELLQYREFAGDLEEALTSLAEGQIGGSVQIESKKQTALLAGIYSPGSAKNSLRDWSVLAEGHDFDAEAAFKELQAVDGLTYMALSVEEPLDFDTDRVTTHTFPWSDWRLLSGAVRDESGKWIVRRGIYPASGEGENHV